MTSKIEAVIAAYLQAVDAGSPPDRDQLLARHPDLADDLRTFFADQDRLDRLAAPLKPPADPNATLPLTTESPTLPPGTPVTAGSGSPLGVVRYFGDYELLEEIARGGMGVVFRAKQVSLNRVVALKMILTGQLASKADVQRFRQEAEAAANLDHPNILPIYEVGEHEGQQYFSMKLVDGGNLAQRFAELRHAANHRSQLRSIVEMLTRVCRAVHFAHQRGILHRDLKPANVLLDRDGTPFVSDFGLAKRVEGDSGLTQSGAIVGTPSYMAPEQAAATKDLTTAADVYSLGAVLYECLTGRPPFKAATPLDTLLQVIDKEPPRPRSIDPRIDRDLETIALKCLEKQPGKRYESAAAVAHDLERWSRHEPILARRATASERIWKWAKRRPAVAALTLTSLLALSGGLAGMTALYLRAEGLRETAILEKADAETQRERAMKQEQLARTRERQARGTLYDADLNLAQQAWEGKVVRRVVQLLDRQQPAAGQDDLRGFEWFYLRRLSRSNQRTLPTPAESANGLLIRALAFTPDGKHLATGGWRDGICAWDASAEQAAPVLLAPGTRLLGSSAGANWVTLRGRVVDKELRELHVERLDVTSGAVVATLRLTVPPGLSDVPTASLSADGRRLVAVLAAKGGVDRINESRDKDGKAKTEPSAAKLAGMLAQGAFKSILQIWDLADGSSRALDLPGVPGTSAPITRVAISADGRRAAFQTMVMPGSTGGLVTGMIVGGGFQIKEELLLVDLDAGHVLARIPRGNFDAGMVLQSLTFSTDGRTLAAPGDGGAILLCDATSGTVGATLPGSNDPVLSLAFAPDGRALATGSISGAVRLWDVAAGRLMKTFLGHTDSVTALAFRPDGLTLASAEQTKPVVKIWDVAGRQGPARFAGESASDCHLAFGPDGVLLVLTSGRLGSQLSQAAQVRLWNSASAPMPRSTVLRNIQTCLAAPDGRRFAYVSSPLRLFLSGTPTVAIRDAISDHEVMFQIEANNTPRAFTPDGTQLFAQALGSSSVLVCDTATGRLLRTVALEGALAQGTFLTDASLTPDGTALVAQRNERIPDGELREFVDVWDLTTGKRRTEIPVKSAFHLALGQDGRLAVGDLDGRVRLIDLATNRDLGTIATDTRSMRGMLFSPDGRRLLTFSGPMASTTPGEIKIWDTETLQELFTLRGHEAPVLNAAFDHTGHRLASVDMAGTVLIWDGTPTDAP